MPKLTDNLGLRMPLGEEYFSINHWNTNMRLLDEAYALLKDTTGTHKIPADMINFNNTGTGMRATTVQAALNELVQASVSTELVQLYVNEDKTIGIPANSHVWIILTFGGTVYQVDFESNSGLPIEWEGGRPSFEPNSTYELSFLKLNCRWFKR